MRTWLLLLERAVTRRPGLVVVGVLVLTAALGALASQAETVDDDTGAIESPEVDAQEALDARFGEDEAVLQVIVRTPGRDVRNADALAASRTITAAIEDSAAADRLASQLGRPAVLGFLSPVELAAEGLGLDPAELGDEEVAQLAHAAADGRLGPPAEIAAEIAGGGRGQGGGPPDGGPPEGGGDPADGDLATELLADGDAPEAGLILAFLDAEGLDDEQLAALQRDAAEATRASIVPEGVEVEPFAFSLLFDEQDIGPEVGRLFGTALAIILVVLGTVYWVRPRPGTRLAVARRTTADVGLTLLAIMAAVVWMQGIGTLLGPGYLGLIGPFSPQTQIVPILVVALGVDYAIHVTSRYREELGAGGAPAAVVGTALRTVGVALVLATGTTVVGFLTNLASPVGFLRTFGVLAAAGIAAAFAITLTLVPAARLLLDQRAQRRGTLPTAAMATSSQRLLPTLAERTSWLAERAPVPTLVVAVALAAVGAWGFTQLDTEFSVTDFVPQDEPLLAVLEALEEDFGGGFDETTEVLLSGDVATPEAHNALLDGLERLDGVDDVQAVGGAADADTLATVLAQADEGLREELADLGIGADGRAAADADVAAAYGLLLDEGPAQAAAVLAEDGGGYLGRVAVRTSGGESRAGELAAELREAFAPLVGAGVDATPTSQEIVQAGVTADVEDAQLRSLLIALAAAMGLLVLNFWITARRPMLGVLTIAPVALVLAYTFGTMALTGIPLTPVTATLAALAIGIGVPFTIHVTHRFQELRAGEADARLALRATTRRTGGALAGSALTTVIGFGVLTTSTLLPFSQLGFVTVYAIGYSLLAAVLVLPSLLILWDRHHRRRGDTPVAAAPQEAVGVSGR